MRHGGFPVKGEPGEAGKSDNEAILIIIDQPFMFDRGGPARRGCSPQTWIIVKPKNKAT